MVFIRKVGGAVSLNHPPPRNNPFHDPLFRGKVKGRKDSDLGARKKKWEHIKVKAVME